MKKSFLYAFCFATLLGAVNANAQSGEATEYLRSSLNQASLKNILEAERVFCYTVEMPSAGYTGYTLDQMALTGFCGILSDEEKTLFVDEFFKNEKNVSKTSAQCVISPRVMLRFYRGVDSTDVLFSYPCPSFSVFYGGSVKSFNTAPVSEAMEVIAKMYEDKRVDFISPTLLNQMLPMGIVVNDEQKAVVEKKAETGPVRGWAKDGAQNASDQPSQTAPKGWNKINIKKNQ